MKRPPSLIQPLVRLKLVRLNIVRLNLYLLRMRKKEILNLFLRRKVEKVTKYDRDYIWGLVQDKFRREGFSETASEIAMTDFERIYQYALDNVRLVRRAEVLAEFVFNGLYSVWNNRVRKGGG